MSNQEILEKAIQKAIDGGWHGCCSTTKRIIMHNEPFSIIFNHDFAKALWGKEDRQFRSIGGWTQAWKYHLQQMVIAEEPIKYLGENI